MFFDIIKPYKITYPVVIDFEEISRRFIQTGESDY